MIGCLCSGSHTDMVDALALILFFSTFLSNAFLLLFFCFRVLYLFLSSRVLYFVFCDGIGA
jgi:hypothetical protein